MSHLFTPFSLREMTFRNRVFVSPMCMYSSVEGMPNDWHLVHLGSRAVGGAALVMMEATGVSPEARISPVDMGIWSDVHAEAMKPITAFIKRHGSVPGIQLAHAGRKASTAPPSEGGGAVPINKGGWEPVAPSAIRFADNYPQPREMRAADIEKLVGDFAAAARRALAAGFEVVELHLAHGYLMHEFLSPLSNHRTDDYGGSLANRMRLPLRVSHAVREIWPAKWPVFARLSCTDWAEGGWDLPQSVELSRALKEAGIDLIDCSSGGLVLSAKIPVGPGYQLPFAEAVRREAGIATGAVGLIVQPEQAEEIIAEGKADCVLLARAMLRDPYWPIHAAKALGDKVVAPRQYLRAID
jgi:2,4-dienoyl-CoA reductase-like NADH-dependent reductase (Old Yellow Enzyme family)